MQGVAECHRSIRESELSQKPSFCLWGAWKFPQRNRRSEKNAENFCHKIQWPEVVQIPGAGVLVYLGHIGMYFCSPKKSTVFQSNLYCKTVIRFSPSFRKNIQHFHLISLPDLTLHTETNDDHLGTVH